MPRFDAYANKAFETRGATSVVVTRTREDGWLEAGVFLLDLFCLGAKDAFAVEMPAIDWADEMNRMLPAEDRTAIHPACARKLIEGAVAYAESLGFAPCRDYNKARRVFGSVKASDCPQSFTYGKDGKPLYIAGPNDDQDRIDRVMRVLTAKLGPEGFHYILPAEDEIDELEAEDEALADHLQEFFGALDRESDQYVLGGMCAAVCLGQPDIEPADLIPILWDGPPPAGWTADDAEELAELISDLWDQSADRIEFADEELPESVPNFADDSTQSDAELRDRARSWSRGFLRVVRAWPAMWNEVFDRTELQQHLGAIVAAAEETPVTTLAEPIPANELAASIGTALLAISAALPDVDDD